MLFIVCVVCGGFVCFSLFVSFVVVCCVVVFCLCAVCLQLFSSVVVFICLLVWFRLLASSFVFLFGLFFYVDFVCLSVW